MFLDILVQKNTPGLFWYLCSFSSCSFVYLSLSSLFYFKLVVFVGLFNVSSCRCGCYCYYRHTQGYTNARRRV